ncbi:hypothetical protein FOXB_10857 [Fusarium oxysporum f. sp. conglutinans Fo5176]|uniref:Uncharacterized protein n=1 Tax=Fusarium oxysporum (strain Fo5176) TaxID=660025 RepID=F9FWS5_FUSOF|nr:hypothetical protein FOXB_10857 [Fusarium oxysporum f. sp. conglutinans Fo5176]
MPPLADFVAPGENEDDGDLKEEDEAELSPYRSPRSGCSRDRYRDSYDDEQRRRTRSPSVPADLDELTQAIVMKYRRVIAARPAAHFARNHEHLTCEEKLIVFILAHPIRNTRNPPYQLTYGFWDNVLKAIFNDWNTDFDCPIDPILPSRIRDYTHIDAGTLVSDHPLPDAKQGSGKFGLGKHHTRGALVKLVVSVNPETDSITFQWCDELGDDVSQSHVTLKEGKTLANLRREVIERYGYHERIRIVDHNEKLLLAFSSRAIKKWVQDGHGNQHRLVQPMQASVSRALTEDLEYTWKGLLGENGSCRWEYAEEDVISISANKLITADDSITRNALIPPVIISLEDTKRVKKNKPQRKDVFAKPQTPQTRLCKDYLDAMEELEEDGEDGDQQALLNGSLDG